VIALSDACCYCAFVSATEIIAELPKLNESERRAISRRILELAAEQEEMKLADDLLMAACREIDRREAEDAKAKPAPR
jgi:hypothetical protein